MPIRNNIADILKWELHITQSQFAASIGENTAYLNKICSGLVEPGVTKAKRIAKGLGKTVEQVWPDTNDSLLAVVDYTSSFMIQSEGKPFRCSCRANCFHHRYVDPTIFTCNGCGADYQGEYRKEGDKT